MNVRRRAKAHIFSLYTFYAYNVIIMITTHNGNEKRFFMAKKLVIDELTGLYDFKSFIYVTEELLEKNPEEEFAILVWDIVQFKVINDLYGMESGDRLLKLVADDFKTKIKRGTCGRIGNDKFACCVYYGENVIDNLSNIFDFYVNDEVGVHKVLMQGGCYLIKERDIPVVKMCDRALLALDRIKGKFTEIVSVYSSSSREEIIMGQTLASDLDTGIKERQFKAYVQPIYYANSNVISGGEVLVRWDHPKFGFMAPGRFIGYFEKNYLITKLDKFIWEEACRMLRRMKDEGRTMVSLSVNVSRTDLYFDDIGDVFIELVKKYDIEPKYLKIEITESAYMDNPEKLKDTVERLNAYGFRILIDDFGSGFSSLNTLKNLPFNTIKIDKSLIDEIDKSVKAGNVVSSIITMAKWLGMDVVAEGVEDINQVNFLKHMGCKYIQGYYFSKPLKEDDFFAKDFDEKDKRPEVSDEIVLDSLFEMNDAEGRSFVNRLVGPLLHYELDGDKLVLKRVNDEFYKIFDFKTPYELFNLNNGEILGKEEKVINGCKSAITRNEPVGIYVNGLDKEGKRIVLYVKIYYVGNEKGKAQFVFNSMDVTKENRNRKRDGALDLIGMLSTLFTEVLVLNYTDNIVNTISRDGKTVGLTYENTPLTRVLDNMKRIVAEEDVDRVMKELSIESMKEFCESGEAVKSIRLKMGSKGQEIKKCEIVVINNKDDYGRVIVTTGNRVIE